MKTNRMKIICLIFSMLGCLCFLPQMAAALDTTQIEKLTGLKGTLNDQENTFKVSYPRGDIGIKVEGWKIPAFMGLTSWATFTDGKKSEAMVMGDLILLQDEVNPVMSELLKAGLTITALHNHFFYDEPKVFFMHIGGEGKLDTLASGIGSALDKIKKLRTEALQPAQNFGNSQIPEKSNINAAPIATLFGAKPQEMDGMVKFVFGRNAKMPCGCNAGKDMGINTWAGFAGTDDNAIVDGDFACLESELQGVLKSLRGGDVNVVAIHNHMTFEEPRYVFVHYWGRGKAKELATTLKYTLDIQAK